MAPLYKCLIQMFDHYHYYHQRQLIAQSFTQMLSFYLKHLTVIPYTNVWPLFFIQNGVISQVLPQAFDRSLFFCSLSKCSLHLSCPRQFRPKFIIMLLSFPTFAISQVCWPKFLFFVLYSTGILPNRMQRPAQRVETNNWVTSGRSVQSEGTARRRV